MKVQTVFTPLFSLLLLSGATARAEDSKPSPKVDYSQCGQAMAFPGVFTGRLNENGKFDLDPKAQGVTGVTHSADGNTDTVSLTYPSFMGGKPSRSKYDLNRKDGRPDSVQMSFDFNLPKMKGFTPPKDPTVGQATHFAYVGDHCYIDQITTKLKSGMEIVNYDHEACNGVLAAVKKHTAAKLQECSMAMFEIGSAIAIAQAKINGPKKQLNLGITGFDSYYGVAPPKAGYGTSLMDSMSAAYSCSFTRKSFGMALDPETDMMPQGGFFGGISSGFPGAVPTTPGNGFGAETSKDGEIPNATPAP